MARQLHELAAVVSANASRFERGINRAISATKRFRDSWSTAGRDIGRSATRITAVVGGLGAIAVKRFADFERTMIRVGGVSNTLGTRDFPKLEAAARKMGKTTEFTATQSAQAMEQLGLAGFNTREIIEALPGALQLATAAQVDIATAADVAAKTMRAFGLEATDLTRINDTLVSTFTRSNTDLRQLAEALKPVGPVAKAAGVSLEDTAAILAKMADAGFQGSLGGTALRNALLRLASPSAAARKILTELGVNAIDPLFVKLKKVEDGLRGAANENEKLNIAAELFGVRGGPALLAALDGGTESIQKFSAELQQAGGLAKTLQESQLNSLTGQFNLLKSAIDDVFLTAGGKLNPTFRDLIDQLKEFVETNAEDIANGLAEAMKFLAEFGRDAFFAFVEFAPALKEAGKLALLFLKPMLEFLKNNPKILGALVALKVTGFLGINSAVSSTTRALGETIRTMAAMGSMIGAKGGAGLMGVIGKFKGVLIFAGVVFAIGQVVDAIGEISGATRDAKEDADALRVTLEQNEKFRNEKKRKTIEDAKGREPGEIEASIRKTKKEIDAAAKLNRRFQGNAADAEKANRGVGPAFGNKAAGLFGQKTDETVREERTKAFADQSRKALKSLEDTLKGLREELVKSKQAERDAAEDEIKRQRDRGKELVKQDRENQSRRLSEVENLVRQAEDKKLEKKSPGLGDARELIGKGADASQLARFFDTLGGDSKTNLSRAQQVLGFETPEVRDESLQDTLGRIGDDNKAQEKEKQDKQQLQGDLENANNRFVTFRENLGALSEQIGPQFDAPLQNLTQRFQNLINELASGSITSDAFAKQMRILNIETQKAAAAAQKKARQERLDRIRRILSGKDTRADKNFLQKEVEARKQAFLIERLNSGFSTLVNGLAGVNNGVNRVGQQITNAGRQIASIPSGGGRGGSTSVDPRALAQLGSFINSASGRIGNLMNNISLLQQKLTFFRRSPNSMGIAGGFGLRGRDKIRIENQLRDLFRELNSLLWTPPPMFVQRFFGPVPGNFIDPGLQTEGPGTSGVTVNLSIQDMNRDKLVDEINLSLMRSGHSRFF